MSLPNKTSRPWFAVLLSIAFLSCLWLGGCTGPSDRVGEDGKEPTTDAEDHEHDGEGEDGHEHDGDEEEHSHGDEEKGGDDEAPADSGPKVDPEKDDVKAGEPSFPKLPE